MAMTGYKAPSLLESEVYMTYRSTLTEDPVETVRKIRNKAKKLTNADIPAVYAELKQYRSGLIRSAIQAYDNDDTVILYNPKPDPKLTLANFLPFITLRSGEKLVTYLFVDIYINSRLYEKDGVIRINSNYLRDLLIGSLLSNTIRNNYSRLINNPYLERTLMNLYTTFVWRVLNRLYSIGADKILFDTVQYFTNRFFLESVLHSISSPETIEEIAIKHFKYVDTIKYEEIRNKYNQAVPGKISQLLELIKGLTPVMADLTFRIFITNWMNYYLTISYLAIDSIEYLLFMIVALENKSGLVSIAAHDIVKEMKGIKSLDEELLKLLG